MVVAYPDVAYTPFPQKNSEKRRFLRCSVLNWKGVWAYIGRFVLVHRTRTGSLLCRAGLAGGFMD